MESAFFVASGLLLLGFGLRAKLRLFQMLYIPASVIGGLVGLAAATTLIQVAPGGDGIVAGSWLERMAVWVTENMTGQMRRWPGWLITIVFAGLLMERPCKSLRQSLRFAVREGIMVWIIALGQVFVGLLGMWLIVRHVPGYENIPIYFGQLIEVGFAGGHGTAAAVSDVYEMEQIGFADGRDLAFLFATVGLIFGVASGIVYVNLAVRRGWTRAGDVQIPMLSGLEDRAAPQPVAFGRVRSEVIDPLVFQALLVVAAVVLGIGLKAAFMGLLPMGLGLLRIGGSATLEVVKFADNLPLFMFSLIGGLVVREVMHFLGIGDLIDPDGIRRLTGAAMEYLIVAAITSLNVSAIIRYGLPVTVLFVLAAIWTALCLLVIGRRLLPRAYWFELGIINYGMSTATTAQGLMLLRIVDKDLDSGAAEDYALAAPLSAPFVGGGLLTLFMPKLLEAVAVQWVMLVLGVVIIGLYSLGITLARNKNLA